MNILKEYIKHILLNEGLFEFPRRMSEEIFNWASKELKEYASKQGRVAGGLNFEKEFRIDLSDWKYGDIINDYIKSSTTNVDDLIDYLRTQVSKRRKEGIEISKEQEEDFINSVRKGSSIGNQNRNKIKVILQLAPHGLGLGGAWQESASTLFLYWYAGQTLSDLKKVIEHELTHMGQTILSKVKKAKAGYPFKKIKISDEHPEHDLQDIEFYTVLRDEIEKAKQEGLSASEVIKKSNFFKLLRKNDLLKFKKAVRELYKNI